MAIKVGISGFGRIGRVVIRAAMDMPEIEIAGINVRNADIDYLIYMLKYDSTFGRFPKSLEKYEDGIMMDGKKVPVYSESEAKNIPWDKCGAEYIVEATGAYTTTETAMDHIKAGAKKVVISAPAKDKTTPSSMVSTQTNTRATCWSFPMHLVLRTVWRRFVRCLRTILESNRD